MYKSCKGCKKLTVHTDKVNNRTGKKVFVCSVCGTQCSGLSKERRAELEERRAEIYREKTFDEVQDAIRQEFQKDSD
jgi:ribosomal protein L37AE/L43A